MFAPRLAAASRALLRPALATRAPLVALAAARPRPAQVPPAAAAACVRLLSSAAPQPHERAEPLDGVAEDGAGQRLGFAQVLPPDIGPLALNRIRDNYGARRRRKRVGRGMGSGRGKTSGRGMKGMRARSGNHGFPNRDGGQTKLQKSIPKLGTWRPKLEYQRLSLRRLQEAIASGRLPVPQGRPITVKDLFDARLLTLRQVCSRHTVPSPHQSPPRLVPTPPQANSALLPQRHMGVTLLGRGAADFTTKVDIEVQMASQTAIEAVERAGGSIETVYYSKLTLRALLKPHRFEEAAVGYKHGALLPRPALPTPRLMRDVYLHEGYRGYLRNLQPGDVVRPHEHPTRRPADKAAAERREQPEPKPAATRSVPFLKRHSS